MKLFCNYLCGKLHQMLAGLAGGRNALRAQGKRDRAIGQLHRHGEGSTVRHSLANDAGDQIALAQEGRGVGSARCGVDRARAAALLHLAVAKQNYAIGDGQRLALVVGDEDEGDADFALQQLQLALHFQAQVGVERGERFIEQQQTGPVDQRPGQRHTLLLSSADLPGKVPGEAFHADFFQGLVDPRGHLSAGTAPHPQAIGHVVKDAHVGKKRVALEDGMDGTAMGRHGIETLAVKQNASRGRFFKTRQNAQQCGFAGAALAQQSKKLALLYVERNGCEHGVLAEALAYALQAQEERHHSCCRLSLAGLHFVPYLGVLCTARHVLPENDAALVVVEVVHVQAVPLVRVISRAACGLAGI